MILDLELLKVNNFQNEDVFQAYCIRMISQEFPIFRGKVWHTQNEQAIEKRYKETDEQYKLRCLKIGNMNKAKGKVSGIRDILLVHNGILYKMELKQPTGSESEAQENLAIIWNKDCHELIGQICYTSYHVWKYCKWISANNLKINFPTTFKMFEL